MKPGKSKRSEKKRVTRARKEVAERVNDADRIDDADTKAVLRSLLWEELAQWELAEELEELPPLYSGRTLRNRRRT